MEISTRVQDLETRSIKILQESDDILAKLISELPFLKITVPKQEIIKDVVTKYNSLVTEQSKLISELTGILKVRGSFADVVKRSDSKTRSRSRSRMGPRANFDIVIKPKTKQSAEATKKEIQKNINPTHLKMRIERVKMANNGNLIVTTNSEDDRNNLIKSISSNNVIKEKYEAVKTAKRKPQIVIFDVVEDATNDDLKELIVQQNPGLESEEFQVVHKYKGRGGWNYILDTTPTTFKMLLKLNKIYINWQKCNVREYLRPRRCTNCFRFGHSTRNCKNKALCLKCGENKHDDECRKGVTCINCCFIRSRTGKPVDVDHFTLSLKCPQHEKEIKRMQNYIDYGN